MLSSPEEGASKTTPQPCFPTPPGSNWEDVFIRFVDGHTVSIRVKNEHGIYNYTQSVNLLCSFLASSHPYKAQQAGAE